MHTRSSQSRVPEASNQSTFQIKSPGWGEPQNEPQGDRTPPAVHDFSHVDLFSHAPQRSPVQMKLTVGAPNDMYEQEADGVAEQVLSMPDPATPLVQQQAEAEEDELQTKPVLQRQESEDELQTTYRVQQSSAPALQAKQNEPIQSIGSALNSGTLVQAQFNWTRSQLEAQAGTKRFRSTEYKNIVRILQGYNNIKNPKVEVHISGLKELLSACVTWTKLHEKDNSTKVISRRQVIQRLATDVTHEITRLEHQLHPSPNNAPPSNQNQVISSSAPPATSGISGYAPVPRDESLDSSSANLGGLSGYTPVPRDESLDSSSANLGGLSGYTPVPRDESLNELPSSEQALSPSDTTDVPNNSEVENPDLTLDLQNHKLDQSLVEEVESLADEGAYSDSEQDEGSSSPKSEEEIKNAAASAYSEVTMNPEQPEDESKTDTEESSDSEDESESKNLDREQKVSYALTRGENTRNAAASAYSEVTMNPEQPEDESKMDSGESSDSEEESSDSEEEPKRRNADGERKKSGVTHGLFDDPYAERNEAARRERRSSVGLFDDPYAERNEAARRERRSSVGLFDDPYAERNEAARRERHNSAQSSEEFDEDAEKLLQGHQTIEKLLNPPDNSSSESESESDDEEAEQPKSKAPADKAARYEERAAKLQKKNDLIGCGVQYTRAYECNPLIDYAYNAAQSFAVGKDVERAVVWYRKTIKTDSGSKFAEIAKQYLTSKGLVEESKYQTSELGANQKSWYTSVKVKDHKYTPKDKVRADKESGLYMEEIASSSAYDLLTLTIKGHRVAHLQRVIDAEAEQDAATTPEAKNIAQEKVDKALQDIEKMATGFTPRDLVEEFRQKQNNEDAPTPKLDQIKRFNVEYLKTTSERDEKKLVPEDGKIKQGMPPRSPEADNGYDTSNLSTNFGGKGYAIFAMSGDGAIYADQHKVSQLHHTSFLAASEAAASGELKVINGVLKVVTNKSGHYTQGAFHLTQALEEFQSTFGQSLSGVGLTFHNAKGSVEWKGAAVGFMQDVQHIRSKGKYDKIFGQDIPPSTIQAEVESTKLES